mgnify:CR=1 FL=1
MRKPPSLFWLTRHTNVIVLCAAIVLNMLGQGVVSPSVPLFAEEFSSTPTLIGLAVVMIATGRMIMSLPGGVLVQTLGRKPVLKTFPCYVDIMQNMTLSYELITNKEWKYRMINRDELNKEIKFLSSSGYKLP